MSVSGQRLVGLLEQGPYVHALARALARRDADDIAQDVWLRAMTEETRDVRRPRAWLASIVRNAACSLRRAQLRRARHEQRAAREDVVPSSAELMEREERRRELVAAVDALPREQRAVVLLRYFDSLPPQAIARELGLPVATVWNRLRAGLATLRHRLDERHGDRRSWLVPLLPAGVRHAACGVAPLFAPLFALAGLGAKAAVAVVIAAFVALLLWSAGGLSPVTPTGGEVLGPPAPFVADPPAEAKRGDDGAAAVRQRVAESARQHATAGRLTVRVAHHGGQPAADAKVIVARLGGHHSVGVRRVRTGSEGTACLDDLVPGEYLVRPARNPDGENLARATVRAGEGTTVDLAMREGVRLYGSVVDRDGVPVAGAVVELAPAGALQDAEAIATTGADGRFDVPGCGRIGAIRGRAAGHAPSCAHQVYLDEGGDAELRLRLGDPAGAVAGTVLGPDGQPVEHAVVCVGDKVWGQRFAAGAQVQTDGEGWFCAVGIPEGEQPITVRAPGRAPWIGSCVVVAYRETVAPIFLGAGMACRGRVLGSDGAPLSNASVVVGELGGFPYDRRITRRDGAFHIDGLAPGATELRVHHASGEATHTVWGAPGEVVECEIRLDAGLELRGRLVTDAGEPLAGALVSAWAAAGGIERWSRGATTDARGRFAIPKCPANEKLTVVARGRGMLTQRVDGVDPRAGELEVRMDAAPAATARIRGQVVGPNGEPVRSVVFAGARLDQHGEVPQPTAGNGGFEFGPLAPGVWDVTVRSEGYPTRWIAARELADHEVWDLGRVALAAGGRVRLRLPGGGDFAGSAVLYDPSFRHGIPVYEQGRHLEPSIASGSHVLVLRGEDVALQSIPVEVRAGEETVVDARPRRGFRRRLVFRAPSPLGELRFEIFAGAELLCGATVYRRRRAPIRLERDVWLGAGEYTVEARGDGFAARVSFAVAGDRGPDIPIPLR
ncbi:MAG: sigma-70 family RNA polymerase sigma factor [Planctomycetota bacterium]